MRLLRRISLLSLLVAGCCLGSGSAFARKRVALIIGNSNYEKATASKSSP